MIGIGPAEIVLIMAMVAIPAVFYSTGKRRRARREHLGIDSASFDHHNDAELMAEFRRVAGPDSREAAHRSLDWFLASSSKADAMAMLRNIPTGSGAEQIDQTARDRLRGRGLLPPDR